MTNKTLQSILSIVNRGFAALTICLVLSTVSMAQPKPGVGPSTTHIFPAGGQRGTTVSVAVGGECLPPGARFVVTDSNVQAHITRLQDRAPDVGEVSQRRYPTEIPITYPKQWSSQITISAHADLGPVYWRLSCADGGTCSRPFLVGDLHEFIETESNSSPSTGERVELPVTINGQISGERDVDYYQFEAQAGDVISCEVVARRLASPLDANVTFHDAVGRQLKSERRYFGSDTVVAVAIDEPGEYLLRIANVSFRGDPSHVYRLNLSSTPFVYAYYPTGGQPGTTRIVSFHTMSGTGQAAEIKRTVTFPENMDGRFTYRSPMFANDVTFEVTDGVNVTESVLADSGDASLVAGPATDDNGSATHSGGLSPNESRITPPFEEGKNEYTGISRGASPPNPPGDALHPPGHVRRSPGFVSLPITIDGIFEEPGDVDEFSFEAIAGEWLSCHCRNRPFHSSAMPVLAVLNGDGKELASASCTDAEEDCRIQWQAPETGMYRVRVRDLRFGSQGGPDYVYRVSIKRAGPDFSLTTAHDCINLVPDTESQFEVTAERLGGFSGQIELRVDGLPQGVQVQNSSIAEGKNAANLKLTASDDVVLGDAMVRIVGVSAVEGNVVERTVQAKHIGADSEGFCVGPRTLDRLTLTVNHKQPFRLFCSEAYQYAHRGSVFMYPMEVERMNGFAGPITLQIGDRQNRDLDGIEMFEVTIPADSNQIELPIYLPETMHINIQSQSQLYAQGYATFRDGHDQQQATLVLAEKRNMLRTLPPVVKLRAHDGRLALGPGESAEVNLFLERTKNFDGPMQLALVGQAPPELTIGQAEIFGGETEAAISVKAASEWRAATSSKLRFRAVGWMGETQLISETTIVVEPRSRVAAR